MNMIETLVRRPVLTTMLLLFLVVMGVYSYGLIPLNMLPSFDIPLITVVTVYPGASPENIETLVSKPIEDAVSAINGIDELKSNSYEGASNVIIKFNENVDVDEVAADVREKVSAIRNDLPADAKEPVILKLDINAMPILSIAISGDRSVESTYKIAEDFIEDEVLKTPGVADVEFIGGRKRELQVFVNQDILRAYHLSPMTLAGIIAQKSLNIPSGHITQNRTEYSIRMDGEFASIDDIRNLPIPVSNGRSIPLGQLAKVTDDFEELRESVRLNGKSAVAMIVKKRADANSVSTAKAVLDALEALRRKLPSDLSITPIRNTSTFILESSEDLNGNIFSGILITALVLFLFLHSFKATVVSIISIPVSIIASYSLIYFSGFSLNMMTQMALAISIGVLVNNAIVVLENIYVHLQRKEAPIDAAVRGTGEILVAVSGCTLTNVVVFTPIAFMTGMVGQFFYEFGLTVTFATFVSLLAAFTVTPMGAAYFMSGRDADPQAKSGFGKLWDRVYGVLEQDYGRILAKAFNHRWTIVTVSALLVASTFLLTPYIGFEFVTEADQHEFDITLKMQPGTSLSETDTALGKIEGILSAIPGVKHVFTKLGKTESLVGGSSTGTNIGEISVKLEDTAGPTNAFIASISSGIAKIPGVELNMRKTSVMGSSESPLQIDITGDSLAELQKIEKQVLLIARETPGTTDVQSSWQSGKPELRVLPKRDELVRYGVTEAFLATTLRNYYEGSIATVYREGDDEYDIRLKLDSEARRDVGNLARLVVVTPGGATVPLTQLARIEEAFGPSQINRKSRTKLITISGNLMNRSLGEVMNDIRAKTDAIDLPPGYSIAFAGTGERMGESFQSLAVTLVLALVLTYMLLAALLESFIHPFTILLTFPLAFGGIFLGLFLTGNTLSIFSLMGVIMLVGIVVNNGILLIEEYKLRIESGLDRLQAVLQGSQAKLRPIIMTTIASVAAMLPLALGNGSGGEMRSGMAVVQIGGLLVSGLLSLFIIPIVYHEVETRLLRNS
ncbi:MAG TPA: efflux RND transporter permease subunit [Candidatus Ozemobacteraceae bacterium]|nr:efflux RND transporter permease subunit [Candidatus Ozemobacteraceae bacterium]